MGRCKVENCLMDHLRHYCEYCGDMNSDHDWRRCPFLMDPKFRYKDEGRSGRSSDVLSVYSKKYMEERHGFKDRVIDQVRERNKRMEERRAEKNRDKRRFESVEVRKSDNNMEDMVFYSGKKKNAEGSMEMEPYRDKFNLVSKSAKVRTGKKNQK